MTCNCEKKSDDTGVNWNMIFLALLILAIVWYFFLKSKGPDAFFKK